MLDHAHRRHPRPCRRSRQGWTTRFPALFAQQHESVVAFINRGQGLAFSPQTLYAAPHPNWGSSGIEPVDLDQDGDLDVLLTHGDTFDDFVLKPYHGIQWLENRGTQPFTPHSLADAPRRAARASGGYRRRRRSRHRRLGADRGWRSQSRARVARLAGTDVAAGLRASHDRDREPVSRHAGRRRSSTATAIPILRSAGSRWTRGSGRAWTSGGRRAHDRSASDFSQS